MQTPTKNYRSVSDNECRCECSREGPDLAKSTGIETDISSFVRAATGRDDLVFDRLLLK